MKKYLPNIIILILWMFIIFSFSNEPAEVSGNTSDRLIIKTVETVKHTKLNDNEKEEVLDRYTVIVRKMAHFFLYFVLGILAYKLTLKVYGPKPVAIIYALIFCFIYASSDEIHQLFVPGRSCEILDILLDTSASLIAIGMLYKYRYKKKKSN